MAIQLQQNDDTEKLPLVLSSDLPCGNCESFDVEIVEARGNSMVDDGSGYSASHPNKEGKRLAQSYWRVVAWLTVRVLCEACGARTLYKLGARTTVQDGTIDIPWCSDLLGSGPKP